MIGSSTESADNTFDLFAAILAPASGATFAGPYTAVSLEFPGGSTANMRVSQFTLNQAAAGTLQPITVNGHAANISRGQPQSQIVSGATYTLGADGSGTLSIGPAANTQLLSGARTLYLSASGNVLLGGSNVAGGHDILLAVKGISGATNATWNNSFFGAGLRLDATSVLGYSGSLAARGQQKVTWSKRIKAMGAGTFDFTGINGYALNPDGTGTVDLTNIALGASGKAFVGAAISQADPGAYEIYFGVQVPARSGTRAYSGPPRRDQRRQFRTPGEPDRPGEFIALFGTGLAKSMQTATCPLPDHPERRHVLIINKPAPLYFVSPGQINVIVPFAPPVPRRRSWCRTGAQLQHRDRAGGGDLTRHVYRPTSRQRSRSHAARRYSRNATNPATAGETVLIYLTGMGAVYPAVADGTAGRAPRSRPRTSNVTVCVAGQQATVVFKGQAPGFPGLYQLNVTLPLLPGDVRTLPLALQTPNAYHDQVDIPIH